jgi:acyl transferase domain-containing protein
MLMQKRSGQCQVPKSRFNAEGFYHPDGEISGTMNTAGGYFLQEDVRQFENNFFGINNLEATYMDPQQRKLLEVVYECLESAGLTLDDVAGTNTGVYVGNFTVDYQTMQVRDPEHLHRYSATGSGSAILANRISHVFDLQGPSFTLNTACSASIYCLHNAANAILNDECDAAIVAGANLITSPEQHLGTMKGGVLSPDSTCHTFDASANGYGRGEAVSAIYLTRVSTALGNNDPIRAVIRATAVNANGRTPGITQPKISGQQTVIEKAYRKAGLDIAATDYVETHGTGTQVGDPMEVEALSRVFVKSDRVPLLIGANKPNLGHSEAASGLSSLIKCVLAFEHNVIPPTMGITRLNPKLKLEDWNMEIVQKSTPWPSSLLRASVNSFGYGGANAHTILESFDQTAKKYNMPSISKQAPDSQKEFIVPVSGSSIKSLEARVDGIGARLQQGIFYDYDNLCYTMSKRRTKLSNLGYILSKPSTGAADFTAKSLVQSAETFQSLPLAYVFTGQGAQWAQMGKELLEDNLVFSETIGDLDDVLMSLEHAPSWTLREALLEPPNSSLVSQAEYSQPLCTAVQIALVKLLTSWGLNATAVVGHSSGEIAAAYAAGLLSEAQAITIAYYRGYAVSQCKTNGQMVAAGIFVDESHEIISSLDLQEDVVVACVNSPESVTISGALDGVGKVVAELSVRNKFAKVVQTGGRAYHSPSMLDIGSEYERLMSNALAVMPRPKSMPKNAPVVQFFCRVGKHGETLDQFDRSNTFYLKPQYWRRNLESPVQFKQAVTNLAQSLPYHMVEIGPHPAMSGAVKNIKSSLEKMGPNTAYCTTLSRGRDASSCMKALAGSLFFAGYDLDFMAVNSITSSAASLSVIHDLPPYKWTYDDLLWSESRSSIEMRNRPFVRHELLGAPILTGNGVESVWRNQFKLEEVPWIADHKLESQIVFPGAGYLAMAIEAITRLKKDEIDLGSRPKISFREVSISAALVLEETDNDLEMFTTIAPTKLTRSSASDRWYDFTISSVKGQRTNSHCSGSICIEKVAEITPSVRVDDSNFDEFNMKPWYEKLATEGLDFGPHFQTIKSLRTDKDRVIPNAVSTTPMVEYVARPESKTGAGAIFVMHPLVIDALLQAATFGATAGKLTSLRAHLPIFIGSMELRPPTMSQINQIARIDTQSHTTGFTPKSISASLSVDQDILINMNGVRLSEYTGKSIAGHAEDKNPCLRVVWKPDITRFDTKNIAALDGYIKSFLESHSKFEDSLLVGRVGAVLDLAEHKNARLNVFELDTYHNNRTEDWLEILGSQTGFPLSKSWSVGSFDQSGVSQKIAVDKPVIFEQLTPEDKFDVILAVKPSKSMVDYSSLIDSLSPQGMIITKTSMVSNHPVTQQEIQILNLSCGLSLITRLPDYRSLDGQHILIIRANGSPANDEIELGLLAAAPHIPGLASVRALPLSEVGDRDVTNNTVVISLLETSMEFLATMTPEGKEHLCRVTNNAKDLIWMTSASTIDGTNSDVQLANGLSRALMLEQPATRFVILDIGQLEKLNASAKAGMVHVVGKILINNDTPDDKEFVLRDGVLHVSRFIADVVLNARFEQRLQKQPRKIKLADVYPARLRIQKIGMMDTIYFQQEDISLSSVASGYLEVDVKAVSPNAKDIYVLSGKVDTQKGTSSSPA